MGATPATERVAIARRFSLDKHTIGGRRGYAISQRTTPLDPAVAFSLPEPKNSM